MLKKDKTTICIIRHGETDWNLQGRFQGIEDIELNDNGRAQAFQITQYFKTERWDVIVSSPLKRAYETAQIVGSQLPISEIHTVNDLIERNYGSASGLLPEERKERFPEGIPDHEEFETLRQRAMTALTRIYTDFKGKKIIVVSHGGLINAILYSLSGGEFGSFKTRLKNTCINRLTLQNNSWEIGFYNKTADELLQPMEEQKKLYSEADIQNMHIAEDSRLLDQTRVDVLINYTQKAEIKRIGTANCVALHQIIQETKNTTLTKLSKSKTINRNKMH